MPRKKEPEIVHPLTAIEALNGYHSDVSILLASVQNAISMMNGDTMDMRKICEAITPTLQENMDRVRRWYEA